MKGVALGFESVIAPTTNLLHRNSPRAQEKRTQGSPVGCLSLSRGACKEQHNQVSILNRTRNWVALEHAKCASSSRTLGRYGKLWNRTTLRVANSGKSSIYSAGAGDGGRVHAVAKDIELMEGDVVEYPLGDNLSVGQEKGSNDSKGVGVGVIVELVQEPDDILCQIEPLCQVLCLSLSLFQNICW
jgi:hypothetical protein